MLKGEKLRSRLKNSQPGRLYAIDGTGSQASATGGYCILTDRPLALRTATGGYDGIGERLSHGSPIPLYQYVRVLCIVTRAK